ncbi:MAG: hypothetical protein BZ136_08700 [Methanosphaera sp. rholeuAM74]|nr:MAG: hypothetical protein BZ136_08700 [Methanosphaera sp. rholeuAM74]
MKNNMKIFLALALATVLILVSAVNATDSTDNSIDNIISEETSTPVSSVIKEETPIKEKIETNNSKRITKTIKTKENTKSATKTLTVNDYQELISTSTSIDADSENNDYIINLNEGTYKITIKNNYFTVQKDITILIEGNNQDLTASAMNRILYYNTTGNTTINYANIHHQTRNNGNLIINNTVISNLTVIQNNNNLIINNSVLTNFTGIGFINNGETIITNSMLNCIINNTGTITIKNCTYGENYIYDGTGTLISDYNEENNKIIENENITTPLTIISNKNYEIINSNITAKISNFGNLTLVNCTLSNNTMLINNAGIFNTFLLENNGNMTILDCVIENNTFNLTSTTIDCNGAIIYNKNNATLVLNNTRVNNNTHIGIQTPFIYNLGVISCFNNCIFTNNNMQCYVNKPYHLSDNLDEFTLNITNSLFENNTFKIKTFTVGLRATNSSVLNATNLTVKNSRFTNNKHIFLEPGVGGGGEEPSGIAISATNLNIDNCTFEDNGLISKHEYTGSGGGSGGTGGAIRATNLVVNNSRFTNNVANTTSGWDSILGNGGAISVVNGEIYNSIFEENKASRKGADIYSTGNLIIQNNTFTNSYATNTASSIYLNAYKPDLTQFNIIITNNTFNNCKSSSDTIVIEQEGREINKLIENNIYTNDRINDELILNIPENIYIGETITITGQYTINNPQCYDTDILEQNKFNVYLGDELVDTIDNLEFTITPADANMILTVQPTISQTRQTVMIHASTLNFTLEDITATIGETTQLTAQITVTTDDTEIEVNTGRVYFKVNGKILRDAETGRIIYADVTENTATLDHKVPKTWNIDTEVTAVFTGNDDLPQKTSNTVNPTITTPETSETEFTVADTTATAGSEVTITVTTKNLGNGKVVLKVNGKTVKADDGKLYAKVTADMTSFTYMVPKTYKAGDYTITAVYTSGAARLEADAKLSVE